MYILQYLQGCLNILQKQHIYTFWAVSIMDQNQSQLYQNDLEIEYEVNVRIIKKVFGH